MVGGGNRKSMVNPQDLRTVRMPHTYRQSFTVRIVMAGKSDFCVVVAGKNAVIFGQKGT